MNDTITINGVEYVPIRVATDNGVTVTSVEVGGVMHVLNIEKPKKTSKRWRAELGKRYWTIHSHGDIDFFNDDRDNADDFLYRTHNYYQTEEQAQKALDKIEALARVNAYIEEHDLRIPADELDWGKEAGQYKWFIYFYEGKSELNSSWDTTCNYGKLISGLRSAQAAQQLIENMKDDLELLLTK